MNANLNTSINSNSSSTTSFGFAAKSEPVKIIRKIKRPASFERRFLSACGKSQNCVLEVAMIWRNNVLSIRQYEAKAGLSITAGEEKSCDYSVSLNCDKKNIVLVSCEGNGKWMLHHDHSMEGFVLVGDEKKPFNEIAPENLIDNNVRAKFVFGEVSILVHYVDKKEIAAAPGLFRINRFGALAASLFLHFALFSIVLFTTDRVDALMIDRIMTSSRFAVMIEPEEVVDEPEDMIDEVPVEDNDEVAEVVEMPTNNSVKSDTVSNSTVSGPISKSQATQMAGSMGLMANRDAMNSLLAMAADFQDIENKEWSVFDASVNGGINGYGLSMTGTQGGSIMGSLTNGGLGNGAGIALNLTNNAKAHDNQVELGTHKERTVVVTPNAIDVSGSLDKRQILKVVKMHTNELRNCYEKELQKVKGLHGRVELVWTISPQGNVTKVVKKSSSMNNANVENCVMNSVKYWRFPAPKGGGMTMIEYPFNFEVSGK